MRGFALLRTNEFTYDTFVIGKSRHPLTAPKRLFSAFWENPRKSKNLRPCAVHFDVLHKVFFCSYFVLANHSVAPAFLPFGTWAGTLWEKDIAQMQDSFQILWPNSECLCRHFGVQSWCCRDTVQCWIGRPRFRELYFWFCLRIAQRRAYGSRMR